MALAGTAYSFDTVVIAVVVIMVSAAIHDSYFPKMYTSVSSLFMLFSSVYGTYVMSQKIF